MTLFFFKKNTASSSTLHPVRKIAHSIIFLGILLLLGGIPSLPVQYYQTFVLEQKHGFNKSTLGLFISDILKGWALAAIIGGPFVAAFLWIIRWAGDGFIPWLMAFLYVFCITSIVHLPSTQFELTTSEYQGGVPAVNGSTLSAGHPATFQQTFPPTGRISSTSACGDSCGKIEVSTH